MVLGIPLIYFFPVRMRKKLSLTSQNEFVKQTEQLIADLSEDAKYSSKSHKLSTEDNRTDTSSTVPQTETLMSAEPQEEITTQVDFTPEENKASLPKWKKELDIFLQGEKSPKEFLDSLTIDNWKEAGMLLPLLTRRKNCPKQRIFRIDSGRELEKLEAKRWQRNYLGTAIQPSSKSSRDGQKERLRKCLIIMLISI